jgi:hypothetical protein
MPPVLALSSAKLCGKAIMSISTKRLGALISLGALAAMGCAQPRGVPATSSLVAQAPGQAASFRAPREGTVWVAGPDHGNRHLIFSGQIHPGETLTVDPAHGQLVLDGERMGATVEGGNATYEVWYKPRAGEWQDWLVQ